jgi:hypothetical protein
MITISAPPGDCIIKFHTDAKQVDAPNDPRSLFFRISNAKITEIATDDGLADRVSMGSKI